MLGIFDWVTLKLEYVFQHPALSAMVVALLVGVFAAEAIVRSFPADYSTYRAQRLLRLISGGLALIVGFWRQPTSDGLLVAFVCGLAAPTLHDLMFGWIYARWPALVPPALK